MIGRHEFISNAIEFCLSLYNGQKTQSEIIELLKTQDNLTHSNFRYSIVRDVTRYIYLNYGNIIKNVRLYGSTMEYNAGKYSDIDMVIQVEKLGYEIYENLKRLDKLLVSDYFNLLEEDFDEYMYLIDIHIIDDNLQSQADPSKSYLLQILQNESVTI
jgi:predicted nucleotidyltransferase